MPKTVQTLNDIEVKEEVQKILNSLSEVKDQIYRLNNLWNECEEDPNEREEKLFANLARADNLLNPTMYFIECGMELY